MNKAIKYTIYFLLAAAVITRAPIFYANFRSEGKVVTAEKIYLVEDKSLTPIVFPASNKKSIALFWASWCGPCKVELNRIKEAVEAKEVSAENIYAISIDEDKDKLFEAVRERKYPFKIYYDQELILSRKLGISSTPTIVFINDKNIVDWQSTGVSPLLIKRIQKF